MKITLSNLFKVSALVVTLFFVNTVAAQIPANNFDSDRFWDQVSFGGGLGLGIGNGVFSATIAPSAVYHFNEYISAGPGLQYSYQSARNFNTSLYGASGIVLANPIDQIQLSVEVEQVYYTINEEQLTPLPNGSLQTREVSFDGWNTALFLGAGYRAGPATIGVRYNVLFQEEDAIYATAFVPFVRVYF